MKCIVLAGGSGDALWPLSRRNYPKQFIEMNHGRSLFQETIARNLPFCDAFYIITNEKYENIVQGQLKAFQSLNYHLFLEQIGRQTAPAVAIAVMCMDPSEDVLVVSTDHMIGEGDYNSAIVKAVSLLEEENIVALTCPYQKTSDSQTGYNFFDCFDDGHIEYISQALDIKGHCESGMGLEVPDHGVDRYYDTGIFLIKAGAYLKALKQNKLSLYEACVHGKNRISMMDDVATISKAWLETIPSVSVGEAVYEKWTPRKKVALVPCDFVWSRLLNLEKVASFTQPQKRDILYGCENVSVINQAENQTVVASGLRDVLIVNTSDAVYVSKAGSSNVIRDILRENEKNENILVKKIDFHQNIEGNQTVFDESDVYYAPWGIKETLHRKEGYQVKKLTIFPGEELSYHRHTRRSEHWSIVDGIATIMIEGNTREYQRNDSILVPMGQFHQISNKTTKDLVVIEVSIGESASDGEKDLEVLQKTDPIVKLLPVYKDYLWGGNRLKEIFGMDNGKEILAESWMMSAHKDGVCKVASCDDGREILFTDYLEQIGKEALGWKAQPYERFPLMVKLIDARQPLSIQLHPDDAYAMPVENDYGKNEMWYILAAKEDAFIYLGFENDCSKEECKQAIEDGTLENMLHKVYVKPMDTVFVPAGTVHAIGSGVLILEVQQSSNATYRLYDYNRRDSSGNLRPLHLDKAMDNLNCQRETTNGEAMEEWQKETGYQKKVLQQCKYFSVMAYLVENGLELALDDSSFRSLVFVEGQGTIEVDGKKLPFKAGDSFFVPAGKKQLSICGKSHFVLSHI